MGLFDDFEGSWDEVPDPVLGLPAGVYEAMISEVHVESKESGLYLVITYTCTEEGPYKGRSHREFKKTIKGRPQSDADVRAQSFVKQRLMDLGVPVERMASLTPDDLEGMEVILTLADQKNDPRYRTVVRVVPNISNATAAAPSTKSSEATLGANPFE